MDKKITPSFSSSSAKPHEPGNMASGECPQPSAKTLALLRSFARNYRAIPQLPQGLQGIILG
ncbi:hypothetical protein [Bacteroides sp. UBA939]|uniref:hypothetical protein n=1 Tax=Bacteroides sp. UBA939 TaxID=1946092 RepID=UPI0025C4FBBD|nr:hypothetical protein [Bacteroides sp. UBA939]